jgi:transmembrane sensor
MNKAEAEVLLEKYLQGRATTEEAALIERWYEKESGQQLLTGADDFEHLRSEIWLSVRSQAGLPVQKRKQRFRLNYRYAAAALLLITLSFGLIVYVQQYNPFGSDLKITRLTGKDLPPGKHVATMTLANGKTIALSSTKNGVVINATSLTYNDGTSLPFSSDNFENADRHEKSIEISTPKGGQYQVVLQDGTRVWLNAASAIKFPLTFKGAVARKIELNGEAYFEVAKDKARPFTVQTGQQRLEVLGTHFNVNAYKDERKTKTTLLEGSVRISLIDYAATESGAETFAILKPGQQAVVADKSVSVLPADTEEAVAWKNGYFKFHSEPLSSIMRKLSRWYDVEIVYENKIGKDRIGGTISRSKSITDVLEMLESTKLVKFRVEGRKIIVK